MIQNIPGLSRRAFLSALLFLISSLRPSGALALDSCGKPDTGLNPYQRDIAALMATLIPPSDSQPPAAGTGWFQPTTRICEKEVRDYVKDRLHGEIRNLMMSFRRVGDGNGTTRISVSLTKPCDGRVLFDLLGNKDECTSQGYYGKPPNLIAHVYGRGACSGLLKTSAF